MCQGHDHHHHHEWAPTATALARPLRIGIGGPVGSGKTALVERLARRLNGK